MSIFAEGFLSGKAEGYKSSLLKWIQIRKMIKQETHLNYQEEFWTVCGFCIECGSYCCGCSLNEQAGFYGGEETYCHGEYNEENLCAKALMAASAHDWDEALALCKIVIRKMAIELREANREAKD